MNERRYSSISRRTFLQTSLVAGSILSSSAAWTTTNTGKRSRVVIVRHPDVFDENDRVRPQIVEFMLRDGLMALIGAYSENEAWKRFVSAQDRVAIKANVMTVPTHTELTVALMNGVARAGVPPEQVCVWDRNCGGIGPDCADPGRWNWGPGYDAHDISQAVIRANTLINVPVMKVHPLSGIGGALKNWAGAVTNINARDENASFVIHADSCAGVACINALPPIRNKCRLIVVDALRPLYHHDPISRWRYQGLILGTDPVAIDTVCLNVLQEKRNRIRPPHWPLDASARHITVADTKYCLGTSELEKIDIGLIGWKRDCLLNEPLSLA